MESQESQESQGANEAEGQVSEVGALDDEAGATISPEDAVAGHPTDDRVQEGAAGPEAPPRPESGDPS